MCPSSAVIEFAETFFAQNDGARLAGTASDERRELPCYRVLDPTDRKGWRETLKLAWHRNALFFLPDFEGSLIVRPAQVYAQLTIEGRCNWRPVARHASSPTIALAIAHAETRALLRQLVSDCEAQWIRFAGACPSLATCNDRRAAPAATRHVIAANAALGVRRTDAPLEPSGCHA